MKRILTLIVLILCVTGVVFAGELATRFPNGVSTDEFGDLWGNYPVPDPATVSGFHEDFYFFTLAEWDTLSQVAPDSLSLVDGVYGELFASADTSSAYKSALLVQTTYDNFQFRAGYETWFAARFKLGHVDSTEVFCGIYDFAKATDTDSLGVVRDGVYFHKGLGTGLQFAVYDDSTGSVVSAATMSDSTYVTVGYYYNGEASVKAFVDGAYVGAIDTTNVPFDTSMPVVFGIISLQDETETNATMWTDFISPWQGR